MGKLQVFKSSEFGELGILVVDGKEYFPATDCAKKLGYANPHEAVRTHCKGVREILTPSAGGEQRKNFIPEGDLYRLIVRSNLPGAERFERWVFDEVLPQIRQAGAYINPQSPAQALLKAVQILAAQEQKIQLLEHRVNNLDAVNIRGDEQQRLNAMVRKYALSNGLSFAAAWKHFVQAFNTAYRTNLELLKTNHPKKLSTPQYLAAVERLDDALRVADKMLNISA